MGQAIAILDKVSYKYPRSTDFILSNISLEIQKGEFLGIIGPTGAGKSTFCFIIKWNCPSILWWSIFWVGKNQWTGYS